MTAAPNRQQISMTDSLHWRELQHLFKRWAQPPFALPGATSDRPSRQGMKRIAWAGSDKEGEGGNKREDKKKNTKNILKRSLNLSKGFVVWRHTDFSHCRLQNSAALNWQTAVTNKRGSEQHRPRGEASTDANCSSATDFNDLVQLTSTQVLSKPHTVVKSKENTQTTGQNAHRVKTHWIALSIALTLLNMERNGFLGKKLNCKTMN